MSGSCKEFSLSATIKNMSRFRNGEDYYTDTEERFNIPWRMCIIKADDEIYLGLMCEKNKWENREWSIETDVTLKLVSHNGKRLTESGKVTFENSDIYDGDGILPVKMISWDELESDYVVDDSIVIEAHVKIIKIIDLPCDEDENTKTFLLSYTVKDISSIEEGNVYYTETATRHNIPWRLQIEREDGFFDLVLICDKEEQRGRDWEIELDYELSLVSLNGQSLNIPARGKITKMTGFDNEKSKSHSDNDSSSADLEDEFSECVINVGGQNYTVKKQ